jgi:3-hydroxyacyl-[acyl-carrier-protein] dehydratase
MENTLLLNNFYSISEIVEESDAKMTVKVELKADHPVYKGHFPKVPVAPGVCLIQMIKEVIMQHRKKNLLLTDGDNIKFMAIIDPNKNPFFFIDYDFRYPDSGLLEVNAIIRWEAVTYLKFKGKFKAVV